MTGNSDDDLESRKEEGRRRADTLRDFYVESGNPIGWFEACYEQAEGEAALIPWGHEIARPEFVEWLERLPEERRRGRALDVGCGLGDNAAYLAGAGFEVTAFDLSPTAIRWAAKRFPGQGIDWRAANLVDPPEEFQGAFDLVNETYTLQALRSPIREAAIRALAGFVKPGGTLLIVGRGRLPEEPEDPPPWPLLRPELDCLIEAGLTLVEFEDFHTDRKGRPVRHFRIEYTRP
ncbi:MAG TPA: class I SAM-dependent methyltransferase [Rhizobiales bacterium]|nr:tellurite methyltransferase [bacterium BMS3Bbin10]HDO51304.1 class I SAM-dependent methyltransferase [Hyphomicrobiales bacterium]